MIRTRMFAALALIAATVFAAVHYSEGSTAEAGLFFRRDGSRRTPLRTAAGAVRQVVENTASRRAARGAPVIFPGLRAAAVCSTGAEACGPCSAGSPTSQAYCSTADCIAEAEAAFHRGGNLLPDEPTTTDDGVGSGGPPDDFYPPPRGLSTADGVGARVSPAEQRLKLRESRLTVTQRLAFNVLKHRPDLRRKVSAYAEARGFGAIDPDNLSQILDALLAFFRELLPLILQLI